MAMLWGGGGGGVYIANLWQAQTSNECCQLGYSKKLGFMCHSSCEKNSSDYLKIAAKKYIQGLF